MKRQSRLSVGNIIRTIVIIALLGVITYESYEIYEENHERAVAVEEYQELADAVVVPSEDAGVNDGSSPADGQTGGTFESGTRESESESLPPELIINYDMLADQNSDFIGWIYWHFDPDGDKYDFTMSYPIVQERTINQYLHTTFSGAHNSSGCIFMDVDSDRDFMGYSDFLFGHNMRNGAMFGSIDNLYKHDDDAFREEPMYVYVYTQKAVYRYVVYEYERTTSGNQSVYALITTDDGYDDYVKRLQNLNNYNCPADISFDGRPEILNLSTCSGAAGTTQRFVVHCVKTGTFPSVR